MLFLNHTKEKNTRKGEGCMINDEIKELREKLDESIQNKRPYDEIYKISVELDELIIKYYENEIDKRA